jgi:hypothetical protein
VYQKVLLLERDRPVDVLQVRGVGLLPQTLLLLSLHAPAFCPLPCSQTHNPYSNLSPQTTAARRLQQRAQRLVWRLQSPYSIFVGTTMCVLSFVYSVPAPLPRSRPAPPRAQLWGRRDAGRRHTIIAREPPPPPLLTPFPLRPPNFPPTQSLLCFNKALWHLGECGRNAQGSHCG